MQFTRVCVTMLLLFQCLSMPANASPYMALFKSFTPFITSFNAGTIRNDFTGWVGFQLTVGSSPVRIVALGRLFITGNTQTHTVKLVAAATGIDVPGGSVSISMSGGTSGRFKIVSLASPIILSANTSYYLVTQETSGQDQWYDDNVTVSHSLIASIPNSAYYDFSWASHLGAEHSYGLVNFYYR